MLARRLLASARGAASFPAWVRGTLTAGGSPVTIVADTMHNAFPGVARLDASRCLLVYRRGTAHLTGGDIYGKIGTITGTSVSWGAAFLILSEAEDVRCEDAVSVIGDTVCIVGRTYDGSVNHDPFVLVCDDAASALTSSSTWTSHAVALSEGSVQNLCIGRVISSGSQYLIGFNAWNGGGASLDGVVVSSSLTDWSAPSVVTVGAAGTDPLFNEIDVEEMPGGQLVAHLRAEVPLEHYVATSADHGATWTAPASAFSAWGYPMWRRLTSGMRLTVYRQASNEDTYWRQSDDDGATWSAETLLDSTLVGGVASGSAYATMLQLDSTHALVVYSIEQTSGNLANLYSQVFTDSSTLG